MAGFRPIALAAACATMMTGTASAQTEVFLRSVAGWDIVVNGYNGGCAMEKVNEDGLLIRIGKTKAGTSFGYVSVYAKDPDEKLEIPSGGNVMLDLDGDRFLARYVRDTRSEDYVGALVEANNPSFGEALARKYTLTVNPDDPDPIKLSLEGTLKASEAVLECDARTTLAKDMGDINTPIGLETAALNSWASLMLRNERALTIGADAVATLVFPQVNKVGLGIGGEGGRGVLFTDGGVKGYYRTRSISFGAQIGAQSFGYAVMFMSQPALDKFLNANGYELGVDGSITLIDAGASGRANTLNLKADTVAFVFDERGFMADLSIEGTRIREFTF